MIRCMKHVPQQRDVEATCVILGRVRGGVDQSVEVLGDVKHFVTWDLVTTYPLGHYKLLESYNISVSSHTHFSHAHTHTHTHAEYMYYK